MLEHPILIAQINALDLAMATLTHARLDSANR